MKKITFKVSTKKEGSSVSLIKEVNNISCRIQIDLENGFVTVENVDDTMIDSVIELINRYYTILNIMIDNISDEITSIENLQSEDDLVIQNENSENKYIEELINRLINIVYWVMDKMNVSEKEIGNCILTSINEILMRYSPKGPIEYFIGDVVDCNYGVHLAGEINGGHVYAIVCDIISGGMAYVVPITKIKENLTSLSYLTFNAPDDIVYNNSNYNGGTALLDKGRYLKDERFRRVIGRATPEFLAEVLYKLSTTFDFTGNIVMTDDDTETDFDNEIVETAEIEYETAEPVYEENVTESSNTGPEPVDADNSAVTITEPKKATKKVVSKESALLNIIGESLKKIDPTKKVEEQVDDFLTDIGMTTSERMVTQSFVVACNIEKIKYGNVILKLNNMFPKVRMEIIESILKENFKNWLNLHPELVESCPNISLMDVLKVFAKRFE